MTSHRPPGPPAGSACPDVDTLADLHADVLDATTAGALRAHVTSCARCQEVLGALDATVATLSSLPPVTIPAHVAHRLERALAEESGRVVPLATAPSAPATPAPATKGSGPTTGGIPTANVVDFGAARERHRGGAGRWLLAAAAAAAVVTGAVIVINQDTSTTGDGTHVAGNQTVQSEPEAEPPAETLRTLQGSTPSEVLENSPIVAGSASEQLAGEMAEVTARNKCLDAIPGRPVAAPEAVQMGMYDGSEAYGFVFPVPQSDDEIVMYVVKASDCSTVMDIIPGTR